MAEVPEGSFKKDEISKFHEEMARSEILNLETKLNRAKGIEPSRAGRISRMSVKSGMPKPVVHARLEHMESMDAAGKIRPDFYKTSPFTAQYIRDMSPYYDGQDSDEEILKLGDLESMLGKDPLLWRKPRKLIEAEAQRRSKKRFEVLDIESEDGEMVMTRSPADPEPLLMARRDAEDRLKNAYDAELSNLQFTEDFITSDQQVGALESVEKRFRENNAFFLPFAGAGVDAVNAWQLYNAIEAIEKGEATDEQHELAVDWARMSEAMERRGISTWGLTASILAELPAFGGELALTGGTYTAVTKGATKGLLKAKMKYLKSFSGKLLRRKGIGKAAHWGAGAAVKTTGAFAQSLMAGPGRVLGGIASEMTPVGHTHFAEDGSVRFKVIPDSGKTFGVALKNSVYRQFSEVFTEKLGGPMGRAFEKVNPFGKAIKEAMLKRKLIGKGSKYASVQDALQKVGIHGVFSEIAEEEVNKIMLAAGGVETYELTSMKELMAQFMAFGSPMILKGGALALDHRRISTTFEELTELDEMVQGQQALLENNPIQLKEIIQKTVQGTERETVKMPVDQFNQLVGNQQDDNGTPLNPRKWFGDQMGDTEAYDEAMETGGDIEVEMADFLIDFNQESTNPFAAELRQITKVAHTDFTPVEVEETLSRLEKMAAAEEAGLEKQELAVQASKSAQKVADDIRDQLLGKRIRDGKKRRPIDTIEADKYAKLYERFFRALGIVNNRDPYELYEQYRLGITESEAKKARKEKEEPEIEETQEELRSIIDTADDTIRRYSGHDEVSKALVKEVTAPVANEKVQEAKRAKRDAEKKLKQIVSAREIGEEDQAAAAAQASVTFENLQNFIKEHGDDITEYSEGNLKKYQKLEKEYYRLKARAMDQDMLLIREGKTREKHDRLEQAASSYELSAMSAELQRRREVRNAEQLEQQAEASLKEGEQAFFQSASLREGNETLVEYGLPPVTPDTPAKEIPKVRDVAVALEKRQREKYGLIAKDDRSPEAMENIANWMVEEIGFEMRPENAQNSGVGWYSEKFQAALDTFGEEFPELLGDKEFEVQAAENENLAKLENAQGVRDYITLLIAVTSDGQKVQQNFALALEAYRGFKEKGELTPNSKGGARSKSMQINFQQINKLISEMGASGMREFLLEELTVGEIKKLAREAGQTFNTQYKVDVFLPRAAIVLGPKLGAFYANLMGSHGYLTMDRWWSRTFNRYRGTLVKKATPQSIVDMRKKLGKPELTDDEVLIEVIPLRNSYKKKGWKNGTAAEKTANTIYKNTYEELEDQPFNASDRSFMIDAAKLAQSKLKDQGIDMTIADLQAVLWYYEKRLYSELGARASADISYKEAAEAVIRGGDQPTGQTSQERGDVVEGPDGTTLETHPTPPTEVGSGEQTFFQTPQTLSPIGFFSALENILTDIKQEKGSAKQFDSMIRKAAGFKEEEYQWTGLEEFMKAKAAEGKGKVTKAEIIEFLEGNGVQVEEKVRGERLEFVDEAFSDMTDSDLDNKVIEINGTMTDIRGQLVKDVVAESETLDTPNKALQLVDELLEANESRLFEVEEKMESLLGDVDISDITKESMTKSALEYIDLKVMSDALTTERHGRRVDATKFGQYTLPGGENYREVLLRLPVEVEEVEVPVPGTYTQIKSSSVMEPDPEGVEGAMRSTSERAFYLVDDNGNWSDESYATEEEAQHALENQAATKIVERRKRETFVNAAHFEEEGIIAHLRIKDYTDTDGNKVMVIQEVQSDWHQAGRKSGYKGQDAHDENFNGWIKRIKKLDLTEDQIEAEFHKREESDLYNEWKATSSTFNKAVPDAPFKGNAWAELAIKRAITMGVEGGYDKIAWTTGQQQADFYDLSKQVSKVSGKRDENGLWSIQVYDLDGRGIPSTSEMLDFPESNLEGIVGKELAEKMINDANEGTKDDGFGFRSYEGLDLKVGGEGMKTFYDKLLPNTFKKVTKKLDKGVKPEMSEVYTNDMSAPDAPFLTHKSSEQVHSIDLSDQMKQNVMERGLTLFQTGDQTQVNADAQIDPMGTISIGSDHKIGIHFFEGANLTTFLHESGHFFLEVMKDLVLSGNAAPEMVADFENVKTWFKSRTLKGIKGELKARASAPGATEEEKEAYRIVSKGGKKFLNEFIDTWGQNVDDKYFNAIMTPYHEMWARGFEKFLADPKNAPDAQLRSLFESFKNWIVNYYKSLTNLNVELSEDIKGVMGRMLATQEEIDEAQLEQSMIPLFPDPEAVGMTENDADELNKKFSEVRKKAEDKMAAEIMKVEERKKLKKWRERKKEIEAEVTQEANEMRVYKALANMQTGKQPNGDELPTGVSQVKINKEDLEDKIGKARTGNLPKRITKPDGMAVEAAAHFLGYESGKEMLLEIELSGTKAEYIERETEMRLHQEMGDPLTPDRIKDEVVRELHNDKRAAMLQLELKFLLSDEFSTFKKLAKKLSRPMVTIKQVRQRAKEIIAKKNVGAIKPNIYRLGEAKASKAAIEAMLNGDYEAAFDAKQLELLNHELYREAVAQKENIEKDLKFFKRLDGDDKKMSKTRDMGLVSAARAILADYGIGNFKDKYDDKQLQYLKTYGADTGLNDVYILLQEMRQSVQFKGQEDYNTSSLRDFQTMSETVRALWHLAGTAKTIQMKDKKVSLEDVVSEVLNKLATHKHYQKWSDEKVPFSKMDRSLVGDGIAKFVNSMKRMEHWVNKMDDGDARGVFHTYMWNPIMDASNDMREAEAEYTAKYAELIKKIEKEFTPEVVATASAETFGLKEDMEFTMEKLLGILLHMGNKSNKEKALVGWGLARIDPETKELNSEQWDKFVQNLYDDGILRKEHVDFVQGVWDLYEEMKPQAQKAYYHLYGHHFDEITAERISTPFGEYRGGYVPAIIDYKEYQYSDAAKDTAFTEDGQIETENQFDWFPTTDKGRTVKRTNIKAPLELSLTMQPHIMRKSLRFSYLEVPLRDVYNIFNHDKMKDHNVTEDGRTYKVQGALTKLDPTAWNSLILPWMNRIAKQSVSEPLDNPAIDGLFKGLRKRTIQSIMFGNIKNALEQITGLSVAASEVGPKYLKRALFAYIKDHKQVMADMNESSTAMRIRNERSIIEQNAEIDKMVLNPTKFQRVREWVDQNALILQMTTQSVVDAITWNAAAMKAAESTDNYSPEDVVRIADGVVRRTQGDYNPESVAAIEAKNSFVKWFLTFFGYFNMVGNQGFSQASIIKRSDSADKVSQMIYLYLSVMATPAIVAELLDRVVREGFDADDDDTYIDDFLDITLMSQVRTATAMVPDGGFLDALINQFNDKWWDDDIMQTPVSGQIYNAGRALYTVPTAVFGDTKPSRAIKDLAAAINLSTGIPTGQGAKTIGFFADWAVGEQEAENVMEVMRGIIGGRSGNQ